MNTPVICYGCGHSFEAMRVTASLKCARCGSDDLDLDDKTSSAHGPGTGWNQPRPNRLDGWNDYQGPPVGRNPESSMHLTPDTQVCPVCHGTGSDPRATSGGYDESKCRNCHGSGVVGTHATSPGPTNDATTQGPPVGGARWSTASVSPFALTGTSVSAARNYTYSLTAGRKSSDPFGSPEEYIRDSDPDYDNRSGAPRKADTRAPEVKIRDKNLPAQHENAPLQLTAPCPECSRNGVRVWTQIARDANDDGWWHCKNCGPLANIDKHPEVNPFSPGKDFQADRSMKVKKSKAARLLSKNTPGKVLPMLRTVLATNSGVTTDQALGLVRNALVKYPESN